MRFEDYEKVSVATDTVILTVGEHAREDKRLASYMQLQVVLVKRDEEPYKSEWSLPGGFVDASKPLEEAANIKRFTKTSIGNIYNEQLYTYGNDINRDPRGRVISVAYIALSEKSKLNIKYNEASKETSLFWVTAKRKDGIITDICLQQEGSDYEAEHLAFDHKKILIDALNRLSNKVMYTDLAFHLLPDKFTINELKSVYASITGRQITMIRRMLANKLEETDEIKDEGARHRPAHLFKLKSK